MSISTTGKNAAFNSGLRSTITQMRLIGTSGQVGETQNISMSHSMTTKGVLITDEAVDFSVTADTTIIEIKLFSASNEVIWTIPLSESYTFSLDGTFTVEEAFVQFNYEIDAIDVGGLTEWGAAALITSGWGDAINFIGAVRSDEEGGVLSTETVYTDQGTSATIDRDVFYVSSGEFGLAPQYLSQIYIDAFGVTVPKFFLFQTDFELDYPYFYFLFSTPKTFDYPNNLTITNFSVIIN